MRLKTFTVPFARVVGPDATELEFGPGDVLVVRPLFGLPRDEMAAWGQRIEDVTKQAQDAVDLPAANPKRKEAEAASDLLILDLMRTAIVQWKLDGPDGPILMPTTPAELDALPGGLASALYPFLTTYRGQDENPTTRS